MRVGRASPCPPDGVSLRLSSLIEVPHQHRVGDPFKRLPHALTRENQVLVCFGDGFGAQDHSETPLEGGSVVEGIPVRLRSAKNRSRLQSNEFATPRNTIDAREFVLNEPLTPATMMQEQKTRRVTPHDPSPL